MKTRIVSIFLSLALMGSLLLSGTAFAADGIDEIPAAEGYEDPMYGREVERGSWTPATGNGFVADAKAASDSTSYADFVTRELQDGESLMRGIDVSVYQGDIDWEAVADSGVDFAIIRVGARGWGYNGTLMKDSNYQKNIKEAQANGIQVGAYIFSQAITEEEAREEAQHIMTLLKGYEIELPLVLDYEYAWVEGSDGGRLYDANLSKEEATAICNAFCDEVEKYGYDSMVYANKYMLTNKLNASQLGRVWLAEWGTKASYTGSYEYWQCSDSGSIPGISGPVDLDFWYDPNGDTVSSLPFTDVQVGQWFYESIKHAYEEGIVNGVTVQHFEPDSEVTRCQMLTMLYRMEGSPEVQGDTAFEDVDPSQYYLDAVLWGTQNGLIQGYSSTEFAPYDSMVREDLVLLLYRKAGSPKSTESLDGYSDQGKISAYAEDAMKWAVEQGLIQGYTDNTIRPRGTTTRAEACTILMRYQALMAD